MAQQPRQRWRTAIATVLIIIGGILAPIAVIGSWVTVSLTDTDRFVATYAPLADKPEVQAFVTDQAVDAINDSVDVAGLTSDVIDGIISLGTGPVASRALEALKGPATQGLQSLIASKVSEFVASDAFSTVWAGALRVSHAQLVSALGGDPDAALAISQSGEVGIQLGPIIAEIRSALIEQGLTFAEQIPTINRTIVVAQSDALPTIQSAYRLAVALGLWLPFIALAFLVAGVLVARRRSVALLWAAVALGLGMALTLTALSVGGAAFVASVSPVLLPAGLATVLFATVGDGMAATASTVLVAAVVVAIVAWLVSPLRAARALRRLVAAAAVSVRAAVTRTLSSESTS